MAINWFLDQTNYELPQHRSIDNTFRELDKEKTQPEFRLLQRIIPDVRLFTKDEFEFAIEIVVTNDVNIDKEKLIEEFKLPTIRVSLQDFYKEYKEDCRTNIKFIQDNLQMLLTDIKRKSWVVPPGFNKLPTIHNTSSDNTGCLLFFLGLLFFFKWTKNGV